MNQHELKPQLIAYLRDKDWTPKGDITRHTFKGWSKGQVTYFLPETVGRALRSLEVDSIVAVKYIGKNTLYKFIPEDLRSRYITSNERVGDKLFKA